MIEKPIIWLGAMEPGYVELMVADRPMRWKHISLGTTQRSDFRLTLRPFSTHEQAYVREWMMEIAGFCYDARANPGPARDQSSLKRTMLFYAGFEQFQLFDVLPLIWDPHQNMALFQVQNLNRTRLGAV